MKTIDPLSNEDELKKAMEPEKPAHENPDETGQEQAANLIRNQINNLYPDAKQPQYNQPNQSTEKTQPVEQPNQRPDPLHQREAYEAWYAQQPKEVQQAEWDRYYEDHNAVKAQHASGEHVVTEEFAHSHHIPTHEPDSGTFQLPNQKPQQQEATKPRTKQPEPMPSPARIERNKLNPFKSLLAAGALSLVFAFMFYNEIVVGQIRSYISPASTVSTPIILDPDANLDIGPEPRVIIPKINVDVPVVYDLNSLEESDIQEALNDGVVDYEYPGTVDPGEKGNTVIVGHSSNNFLNSGKYKFAFVLLSRLEKDDTFILHYEGQRYVYKVFNKQIVEPTDFSLIETKTDKPIATLITCDPPGTSWDRLVIQGEQISPSPDTAVNAEASQVEVPEDAVPVPGNSPSLWSRILDWF